MADAPTLFEQFASAVARADAQGRPIAQFKAPNAIIDQILAGMEGGDERQLERVCGIVFERDHDDSAPCQAYDGDGAPLPMGELSGITADRIDSAGKS